MYNRHLAITFSFSIITAFVPLATAQNTTTGQIHGMITDPSGAGVPGAAIIAHDISTGIEKHAVSASDGNYTILDLQSGKYRVIVTMLGFEKAVVDNVVVDTGRTTDQPIGLAIGSVNNVVEISGVAPVLETTSSQVATTIQNNDIQDLPLSGRDTLPFATLMAGNQSVGGATDNGRTGTFNGLPNASMNISLDGMNNNSQRFKSGGTSFFEFAPARLDAIEQVTVATTGNGADAAGVGAMQIKLVTRRGTEHYHAKVFEQFRNDDLNANTFFSNISGLPRTKVRQNDLGGNFGGRLVPFGSYVRDKLFFFLNFEATPLPTSQVSTATMLTPEALTGVFRYVGSDNQTHTLNVLQFAGNGGNSGVVNPVIQGILGNINATSSKGVVIPSSNLYQQTLTWNQSLNNNTYTRRCVLTIRSRRRSNGMAPGTCGITISGVPQYPGLNVLGSAYKITTYVASNSVGWSITPNMLNSFNFGVQSNGEFFNQGTGVNDWAAYNNNYYNLGLSVTPLIPNQTPFIRNNPVFQFSDNFTWLKGRHTISIGGSLLRTSFWEETWNAPGGGGVLTNTLGVDASDPISALFSQANINGVASQAIKARTSLPPLSSMRL